LFLLDFDRGRIMPNVGAWAKGNLLRLHRSLQKISNEDDLRFTDQDWELVMTGYRSVLRA
jgi:hypothetical protein